MFKYFKYLTIFHVKDECFQIQYDRHNDDLTPEQ